MKILGGLNKEQIERIKNLVKIEVHEYDENQIIANENDKCTNIYELQEGALVIKNIYYDGNESIIKYINPGDIFGDILIFSNHFSFPATIVALKKSKLISLSKDEIVKIITIEPQLAINLLNIISNRAYELNNKVKLLNHRSIRSRISFYLFNLYTEQKNTTLLIPHNREKMASIINVERPSLSRELGKMKRDGIIDYYLNTVKILDVKKLENCI